MSERLISVLLANGDPNGNFNPKDDITRAEVVKSWTTR
ncbi:hypothetical protein CDQ84_01660 [Clostridium thermosuccinogenes]|uniref:SLH domain-containing protein n=1 Tax=Clostridium thermosuccinogenes TaxID=84032 RepID=A0A2K2FRI8_9CLOT|nr:S-layer homology domain-containing protein [Pseudoclostridium thermosuccinogenes]AUS95685.1 hypothetical protein CDO33_04065 [Pseudoclostridium thermosuccinogenes]PNT99952.1 hypothetical protein CDQ85_01660 [Pseudoclostridium thermosuccinogenes]PNU01397.1 hypothetical protein CDQ84_01660 [Pseudoclostridium thermosuccinogenes]